MKISTKANQTKKEAILKGVGLFAVFAFVAASAAYIYSPISETNAAYKDQKKIKVKVDVDPSISLKVDTQKISLAGPVNTFVSDTVNVDVTTNSAFGYNLTIEDKDDNTNMVHRNTDVTAVVSSTFDGAKTPSQMPSNSWGYSLNETDYNKIPARGSAVVIKTTNQVMTTDYDRTPVDFGVKIGPTLTSGHYEDSVLFTAYVNGQDDPNNSTDPDDPTDPNNPGGNTGN